MRVPCEDIFDFLFRKKTEKKIFFLDFSHFFPKKLAMANIILHEEFDFHAKYTDGVQYQPGIMTISDITKDGVYNMIGTKINISSTEMHVSSTRSFANIRSAAEEFHRLKESGYNYVFFGAKMPGKEPVLDGVSDNNWQCNLEDTVITFQQKYLLSIYLIRTSDTCREFYTMHFGDYDVKDFDENIFNIPIGQNRKIYYIRNVLYTNPTFEKHIETLHLVANEFSPFNIAEEKESDNPRDRIKNKEGVFNKYIFENRKFVKINSPNDINGDGCYILSGVKIIVDGNQVFLRSDNEMNSTDLAASEFFRKTSKGYTDIFLERVQEDQFFSGEKLMNKTEQELSELFKTLKSAHLLYKNDSANLMYIMFFLGHGSKKKIEYSKFGIFPFKGARDIRQVIKDNFHAFKYISYSTSSDQEHLDRLEEMMKFLPTFR